MNNNNSDIIGLDEFFSARVESEAEGAGGEVIAQLPL